VKLLPTASLATHAWKSFAQALPPLAALALTTAIAVPVAAAEPAVSAPVPAPARVSFDAAKLAELKPALQAFVDDQQIGGAVTVIGGRGQNPAAFSTLAVGYADVDKKTAMKPDAIFRIASMTKIATAVGVMILEDDGKLTVDDPVEKHLPEFRGQKLIEKLDGKTVTLTVPARPITIKDLLTHTSGMQCSPPPGFAQLYRDKDRTLAEGVVGFSQHPLETAPGTKWRYCSTAYDTIGRVIEVAAGKPYEVFMAERLFRPLGMKDTTYRPTPQQRARLATLYKKDGVAEGAGDAVRGHIARAENQGVPGPPTGDRIVYPSPSGGIYTTARDYALLAQMLLEGGSVHGRRILRPETLAKMASVHFTYKEKVGFTPGLGMGLGVQVVMTPTEVTEALAPGSFGHGGAYGTQAWIDPKTGVFYVLMIQRQGFGNGDQSEIRKVFQKIGAAAVTSPGHTLAPGSPTAPPKG
jgi:CubicO group peptidase (beta-lactamase class C family)